MEQTTKVCQDLGNDARSALDHRSCTGQVLAFVGEDVVRTPCGCSCHDGSVEAAPVVAAADEPEPVEVICSRCRALLEDSEEDFVESEAGMDALRMDRRFARQIGGRLVCLTCHTAWFAPVR